ncbi:MAG: isoprenylcysteine carboxylmethyltransferase family protein [Chloroflexi bacterium]|nr:MAG: isoprenylcysteine carboxylmethyltransferase family protein [Chloroflexota bacterium]
MYLINQRILGIVIVLLLAVLVATKQLATGSILDKPKGNFLVQLVNLFNLFFLLVVNPLVAILLIMQRFASADPTRLNIANPPLLIALSIVGITLYVAGFLLMVWGLSSLRSNYQLGGSAPRDTDRLVIVGPYRLVRHPMYAAALYISLGLACLTQSLACFAVFCVYLVLILLLIPVEENGLQGAYGQQYIAYQQKTGKIIPFVF